MDASHTFFELHDAIIVGGGPAGLSAALLLGRCRRRVLLVDDEHPRNAVTRALHGFLSRDGIAPLQLLKLAREQIAAYPLVELRSGRVIDCSRVGDAFRIDCLDGRVEYGRKVILATGKRDELPDIPGIADFYGTSVFHCPFCDGYEVAGKAVAVYARACSPGLAYALQDWASDLVLCTDGTNDFCEADARALRSRGIPVRTDRVVRAEGRDGQLQRLVFDHGPPLAVAAMFFSTSQLPASPLASELGCRLAHGGAVDADRRQLTSIPGVWVVGDAAAGEQLAIVAAAEGAKAAIALHGELAEERWQAHHHRSDAGSGS